MTSTSLTRVTRCMSYEQRKNLPPITAMEEERIVELLDWEKTRVDQAVVRRRERLAKVHADAEGPDGTAAKAIAAMRPTLGSGSSGGSGGSGSRNGGDGGDGGSGESGGSGGSSVSTAPCATLFAAWRASCYFLYSDCIYFSL